MFKKHPASIATAVLFVLASASIPAAQAQVATVNGVAIPQVRLETILKARLAGKQPDSPEIRTALRDTLINQEVIAQEAIKKGLNKNPEIAAQIDLQRQEILVNAFVQEYMKNNPVTDDTVRKEYERIKPTIPAKEFKVRHILVDKEDEAKDILAQIKMAAALKNWPARNPKTPAPKRAAVISIGRLPGVTPKIFPTP